MAYVVDDLVARRIENAHKSDRQFYYAKVGGYVATCLGHFLHEKIPYLLRKIT